MARATPLPAEERRAAIIAAAERLILAQGSQVGTRAIAEAAGIAEGTIFRVFPTKAAIIDAIFEDALDPEPGRAEIAAIDGALGLEARMIAIVAIVQRRVRRTMALFAALGAPRYAEGRRPGTRDAARIAEIAAILAPDRAALRVPPEEAALLLTTMAAAASLPTLGLADDAPAAIVDLILHGIAAPATPPAA